MIPKTKAPTFSTPVDATPNRNIGIGGIAGVGKTFLLGTVGKGNKVLILDSEGGTITFNNPAFQEHPEAANLEDIHVVTLDGIDTWQALQTEVLSVFDYLAQTKNGDGYALLAVDSLTELQSRFLRLHQASDPRQSYGAWSDFLQEVMFKAQSVPVPIIFTARVRSVDDEILGRTTLRMELAPSAWKEVVGMLDAVGLYDLKVTPAATKRVLSFDHTVRFPGKDRVGLGKDLVEPSFKDLLARYKGEEPEEKATPARRPTTQTPAQRAARR
jgi:hypothetical protein